VVSVAIFMDRDYSDFLFFFYSTQSKAVVFLPSCTLLVVSSLSPCGVGCHFHGQRDCSDLLFFYYCFLLKAMQCGILLAIVHVACSLFLSLLLPGSHSV
jgi:hypothetical protein